MPINIQTMNKFILSAVLFFCVTGIFAAPLENGHSASKEEKGRDSMDARNKVINEAAKYENTPYVYGGMTPSGLDCSGLICLSFKDALGVSLPRSAADLYSWAEKIALDKAQPGDFLFFRTDNTGKITHVALYLGDRRFIHSASDGPETGVIYSSLDERYWANAFAGAGRALPEAPSEYKLDLGSAAAAKSTGAWGEKKTASSSKRNGRFLFGAAVAPTWNFFLKDEDLFRGIASQFRIAADTSIFGQRMIFGMEIRPEYDSMLGVFRIPVTLSWGPNDNFLIFAGPVLSLGDPSISTNEGERNYSGGTGWIGAAGLTVAPFIIKTAIGEFSPYLEAAWQYYFSENENKNFLADISAGFRFSTGIRWTMQIH